MTRQPVRGPLLMTRTRPWRTMLGMTTPIVNEFSARLHAVEHDDFIDEFAPVAPVVPLPLERREMTLPAMRAA